MRGTFTRTTRTPNANLTFHTGMRAGMQITGMRTGMQNTGLRAGMQITCMRTGMQITGMHTGMHTGMRARTYLRLLLISTPLHR